MKNTFYPRYCYEEFELIKRPKESFIHSAIPMVCFCDTPLSQLMNHIETYGKYGLGMKKEWGIRKGLNPVIYFNKNSDMAKDFNKTAIRLLKSRGSATLKTFWNILVYLKPYEGVLYRGGSITKENVRFYDEHEWRYVPDRRVMNKNSIKLSLLRDMYQQPEKLADANKELERDETRLSFNADDIKYIIIDKEREINEMIKELRVIKGMRYNSDTIDRLASRIITVKQIENDF